MPAQSTLTPISPFLPKSGNLLGEVLMVITFKTTPPRQGPAFQDMYCPFGITS